MVPAFAGTQTLGAPAKAGAMAVRKGRLQPAGFSRRVLSDRQCPSLRSNNPSCRPRSTGQAGSSPMSIGYPLSAALPGNVVASATAARSTAFHSRAMGAPSTSSGAWMTTCGRRSASMRDKAAKHPVVRDCAGHHPAEVEPRRHGLPPLPHRLGGRQRVERAAPGGWFQTGRARW